MFNINQKLSNDLYYSLRMRLLKLYRKSKHIRNTLHYTVVNYQIYLYTVLYKVEKLSKLRDELADLDVEHALVLGVHHQECKIQHLGQSIFFSLF